MSYDSSYFEGLKKIVEKMPEGSSLDMRTYQIIEKDETWFVSMADGRKIYITDEQKKKLDKKIKKNEWVEIKGNNVNSRNIVAIYKA
jgi:hypothetical protein